MRLFDNSDSGTNIAAKYSLQTMSYVWIKAYSPEFCCSNSIAALNKAEDTLAIVIVNEILDTF